MHFLGFFLSTIIKTTKSAYTVSYAFILVGLVMEIFLSNYTIIYFLYSNKVPWWVDIIKFVFALYPPFNFSLAYSDITNKSASYFDNYKFKWVQGDGFTWSDLIKRNKNYFDATISYDVPSPLSTISMFFVDILLYSLFAFYFDHVDSSNRGKSFKKLFFLDKNYWCHDKIPERSGKVKKVASSISKDKEDNENANENVDKINEVKKKANKDFHSCIDLVF